ncbi:polysaccharide deacetylase family protein [candidate division GN15 bacterium]|nr:polysaccharide deacetylase family protein [candidate division GN15 bacterium]
MFRTRRSLFSLLMTESSWFAGLAIVLCVFLWLPGVLSAQSSGKSKESKIGKEIAITFDELPAARTFEETDREAVTYLVLNALKHHEVKAVGFVIGNQIGDSFDLLGQWLNDGHKLGNMGYSGQDYNLVGPEQFIRDVTKGAEELDPMLSGFGQKKRYFRFPYLHYGETVKRRRAVDTYLDAKDYIVCPATVIPEDYLYNLTLGQLGKRPDSTKYNRLMNDYVNSVLDELDRQSRLAHQSLGRRVRHILRLRLNRLNAVFLQDLLIGLKGEGYTFVTLDKALQDEVYSMSEAYYGIKGLSWLEMITHSDPDLLPAE